MPFKRRLAAKKVEKWFHKTKPNNNFVPDRTILVSFGVGFWQNWFRLHTCFQAMALRLPNGVRCSTLILVVPCCAAAGKNWR